MSACGKLMGLDSVGATLLVTNNKGVTTVYNLDGTDPVYELLESRHSDEWIESLTEYGNNQDEEASYQIVVPIRVMRKLRDEVKTLSYVLKQNVESLDAAVEQY